MKMTLRSFATLLLLVGLWLATTAAEGPRQGTENPSRLARYPLQRSTLMRFLASERGRELLRRSPHLKAPELLRMFHGEERAAAVTSSPAVLNQPGELTTLDAGTVASSCGTSSGTKFNLEPSVDALPQHGHAVDFFRNGVTSGVDLVIGVGVDFRGFFGVDGSTTGYYVSRDSDCGPEFEGALPAIDDPLEPADTLFLGDDPMIAVDPARNAVFAADVRGDSSTSAIAVFRTTRTALLSTSACPNGTHTDAQAATCWPTRRALGAIDPILPFERGNIQPHMAVDERTSGTGAGVVYIAWTLFHQEFDSSSINLVACTNSLGVCSAPITINGAFGEEGEFPHVAVRPDGSVTITWVDAEIGFPLFAVRIFYRSCTPSVPPAAPACGPTRLVHDEPQRLSGALVAGFGLPTAPTHDHRSDANGVETYVVWARCKVDASMLISVTFSDICPDADIVMKASNNNGVSWSAVTCVDCASQDQFNPAIWTDRSRNVVNIAYYSSFNDKAFQHRVQVVLKHINPGTALPDPTDTHVLTTLLNDPCGEMFFGNFCGSPQLGVAARGTGADGGSRAYVHYTFNNVQAKYLGVSTPQQNNHVSRFDY